MINYSFISKQKKSRSSLYLWLYLISFASYWHNLVINWFWVQRSKITGEGACLWEKNKTNWNTGNCISGNHEHLRGKEQPFALSTAVSVQEYMLLVFLMKTQLLNPTSETKMKSFSDSGKIKWCVCIYYSPIFNKCMYFSTIMHSDLLPVPFAHFGDIITGFVRLIGNF